MRLLNDYFQFSKFQRRTLDATSPEILPIPLYASTTPLLTPNYVNSLIVLKISRE